uniref:C3H1-type domain-containing protein n=1 Tax=Tetraodon nigroviridis TaxID=99883 RepID=H3CFM8_TETNG
SQVSFANPLSSTHKFLQACSACFLRKAPGTYAFVHKPDLVHKCKQDVLLCKRKGDLQSEWAKVRPLPQMPSFNGPFVLCKDMMRTGNSSQCKFGENCTFAYNQLEIDVWTMERTGKLDRNLLFETTATKLDPVNRITCLLQEYQGVFCKDDQTICSEARHPFDANRCLAFEAKGLGVSKVRLFNFLCRLDLCAQSSHLHSQREDGCNYAHSVIELRIWMVQHHTGISQDDIVKVSTKYYNKHEPTLNRDEGSGGARYGLSVNLKMEFACAQCWQAGLKSFPDRALKYCCGRARHPWTKDRSVLLVTSLERKKPVQIRPLPHAKHVPNHYEICIQVLKNKKCNYPGNCTFAHSPEEREMWMYMKNNDYNMDQMYDMWLSQSAHSRQ